MTRWCNNLSLAGKRPVLIKLPLSQIQYLREVPGFRSTGHIRMSILIDATTWQYTLLLGPSFPSECVQTLFLTRAQGILEKYAPETRLCAHCHKMINILSANSLLPLSRPGLFSRSLYLSLEQLTTRLQTSRSQVTVPLSLIGHLLLPFLPFIR